jgi:hypothetical protein
MKQTDLSKRLENWIKTQHGTAGWEQKLENLISTLLKEQKEEERQRILERVNSYIDTKYPPNMFFNSETGEASSGVQEETCIRRMTKDDEKVIEAIDAVKSIIEGDE